MDFEREIVRVYFTLKRIARFYGGEYADDLAAEAVTRAIEHRDSYDPSYPLLPWCRAIMRNLWVNEHRQQVCMVGLDGVDVAGGVAPDDVVEVTEALSAVRSMCTASVAVETLVEYAQGYSLAEIADRNGVPLGTVKRRIHDARMMIKRKKPLAS